MAFVGSVQARIRAVPGEPGPHARRLLDAVLRENHLRPEDVLAAVVRWRGASAPELPAALRAAGVCGVPVFASAAAQPGLLELELHVRLRRRRRLRTVELA